MSDQDRPDPNMTPRSPEHRPQPGSAEIEGPTHVYDRPERSSGGLLAALVVLVVLALLVFLLIQFVF